MLFNSLEFLIFFPTVLILYFLTKHKYRWILLLIASYYFYMAWKPAYIILIVISTIIDYWCGRKMGELETKEARRPFLYLSLLSNLGILFTFKYFNFFNQSLAELSTWLNLDYVPWSFQLLLPMGISFYTFQTMSYSIDIYYGRLKPELHFGKFALFVTFFPQLVAGPIERASNLLPQFHRKVTFDYQLAVAGLKQMGWGLFKKVVIADRLAVLVNAVYDAPTEYQGFTLILATIFFAFQIYCDFSGYSDIAIGAAKVLGFDLMRNFRTPYFSKTISEFWRRWHISLSTWFRDYVYIPLGGNRVVKWRWYYNLMVTFVVSGLWHGANWTFVIWGGLHGLYLVAAVWLAPMKSWSNQRLGLDRVPALKKVFDVAVVFVLVNLAWVFFRAESASSAFYIIGQFFDGQSSDLRLLLATLTGVLDQSVALSDDIVMSAGLTLGLSVYEFILAVSSILFLVVTEWLYGTTRLPSLINRSPIVIRWGLYYAMIYSILLFRHVGVNEFIYFQF